MRVVLYTAIYGDSDWVKPAPKVDVPCILYTDNITTAWHAEERGWIPHIINHGIATLKGDPAITAPMLAHKWWKTHPELACPDADISVWIDGSMEVTVEGYVGQCLDRLGTDDWSATRHPERSCIYPEATLSAALYWRYDAASVNAQAAHYSAFHPHNWGLVATGCCVRRHTPEVIEVCHQWWHENITWSHQDQLSIPVLLRLAEGKVKLNYNMPWHSDWTLHPHGTNPNVVIDPATISTGNAPLPLREP